MKIEQKQSLTREEAARFIAELAAGLADDGKVTVRLGSSTLELSVADQLRCELEVAVDGDEIELELELKWSTGDRASAQSTEDESPEDEDEDEAAEEDEPDEDDSAPDATAEDAADEGESDGAGPDEAESEDTTVPGEVCGAGHPSSPRIGDGRQVGRKRRRHRRRARLGDGQRRDRPTAGPHQGRGDQGIPRRRQLTDRR